MHRVIVNVARVALWWAVVVSAACRSQSLVGNNCELSPGVPCPEVGASGAGGSGGDTINSLDVLFVIENTPAMLARQRGFADAATDMLRSLLTGIVADNEVQEFEPVEQLRVAVVSTDMGAPGVSGLGDCGDDTGMPLGDDGLFQAPAPGATTATGVCSRTNEPLDYSVRVPADRELALHEMGCRVMIGGDGCQHSMPLEAALKALWDRDDGTVTFLSGTGHGLSSQADFVRPTSLLAIVIVTTQDDCSSLDVTHLLPADQLPMGDPLASLARDERCDLAPEYLHRLSRYRRAYSELQDGRSDRVFLGVIAGVPPDLANEFANERAEPSRQASYTMMLEDPRMLPPVPGTRAPSCGDAYAPRRLVELARQMGPQAMVASICDEPRTSLSVIRNALARQIDPRTSL